MSTLIGSAPLPRWIAVALLASLGLNCLLLGGGGAMALRWRAHPEEQALRVAIRQVDRHLDRDDARTMRATVQQHRPQIASAWQDYHQSLLPLAAALQAPAPDQAKLQEAAQQARAKRVLLGDAVFDAVLDGAQKISPEGRAALLKD